ncbi:hypothetical protein [Streptomyces bacillaris]|uniref:hypothetical protein n=1 Tax=Streptomyces bacillaris TaxID=68179 RepID=UPI003460935D
MIDYFEVWNTGSSSLLAEAIMPAMISAFLPVEVYLGRSEFRTTERYADVRERCVSGLGGTSEDPAAW